MTDCTARKSYPWWTSSHASLEEFTACPACSPQVSAGDQGKPGMSCAAINGPISQPAESKSQTLERLDDEHSRHWTPRPGCSACSASDVTCPGCAKAIKPSQDSTEFRGGRYHLMCSPEDGSQ